MPEPTFRLTGRSDMQWNEFEIEIPGLGVIGGFITDDRSALAAPDFAWSDDACATVAAALDEERGR